MSELARLQSKMRKLQHENEACKLRISSLESDLSNLMKKNQFSASDINDYFTNHRQIAELQEKLQRAEAESNELRSTLASQNSNLLSTLGSENPSFQSIIDANNRYTLEMTQKAAKRQKQLSDTMFENATLKKSISLAEAENAKLTAELQDVKWKLENSNTSSSNSNKNESEKIIQNLQRALAEKDRKLKEAKETIQELETSIKVSQKSSFLSISNLNRTNEISEFSREIEKHKEELLRAQQEIKRLTDLNKASDAKIAAYEKEMRSRQKDHRKLLNESMKLQASMMSQLDGSENNSFSYSSTEINTNESNLRNELRNAKAICASLRDENDSLKEELNHLRIKANDYKEAYEKEHEKNQRPNALREEVIKLRDELKTLKSNKKSKEYLRRSPSPKENYSPKSRSPYKTQYDFPISPNRQSKNNIDYIFKKLILQYSTDLALKFEFFQTKIGTELDKLELKFERFETFWKHALATQKRKLQMNYPVIPNTAEEFVNILRRESRIIKTISINYAKSHNIPKSHIPHPADLIGDSDALRSFVFNTKQLTPLYKKHRSRY